MVRNSLVRKAAIKVLNSPGKGTLYYFFNDASPACTF